MFRVTGPENFAIHTLVKETFMRGTFVNFRIFAFFGETMSRETYENSNL